MTGIFITARLGSTRLSQKHLIKADDYTFIEWLVKRFYAEFEEEISNNQVRIFVVSSSKSENKQFEDVLKNEAVTIFYGSDDNIPLRHLQGAEAYKIDQIISIDGDDILCSTQGSRLVMNSLINGSPMAKTSGLPLGMNIMGYSSTFLKQSLQKSNSDILETGWGRIFDNGFVKTIPIQEHDGSSKLRMTLDYEPDAEFFGSVINSLGKKTLTIKDNELIAFILENKFHEINEGLNDEYWINFNSQKDKENK